ncbi:S-layer homology domain-containing protein [Robertmurraya sp. DFI.2.37]|uniref:S-layer homology domain-containing protein n=1 Tax=Robertmurraya sp. DFI.2.37 TaxID=3031819 RepID=UPI001247C11C|nr:S-layer homology domain-containing protein [Robertmurraya sp. DFI.2.37]MDF1511315.1 S-layer homology domain-containing protein [Robertmurraya sp. DFI.2.37]
MLNSHKKFIATSATVALATTAIAPFASAEEIRQHQFTDVGPRYDEAVSFLYHYEIVQGKSTTSFGVNSSLTRGDAAVILANALGLDTENAKDAGFKDLFPRVAGAVNALAAEGIVKGFTSEKFAPNEPISRGAMAQILVLGFGLEDFAAPSPFTDAGGTFQKSIEALYGTGITNGVTKTSFGAVQNIKRGDFANLLYNTIQFIFDNSYFFYAESMELINSSSLSITFDEELAEDLTEEDIADLLLLEMEVAGSDEVVELLPTKITISEDRTSIIVEHADLAGKEGTIFVDDIQAAFDYAKPGATTGSVTLEGFDTPFTFDFDGATETTIKLPATDGVANLNALELEVVDQFTDRQEVTVILESTDVEAAKPGEGLTWGTLVYEDSKWKLVDHPNYDIIPAGNYVLQAPFTDKSNNTVTLTIDITVE